MVYRCFFCIHQNGIFGDGFWLGPGNLPALGDRVPLPLANALAPGGMNGSSSSFAIVHMVSSIYLGKPFGIWNCHIETIDIYIYITCGIEN
jgi:hypothetical protein